MSSGARALTQCGKKMEEAYADASRTDTYLNVYDASVFLKFVVG